MKTFVAITAETLQGVDVVHVIAKPAVIRMVDDEFTAAAALTAPASGIVLYLHCYQVPVSSAEEVLVRHAADSRRNLVLVGAAGFRDHLVEAEALLHFPRSKVLLNENVCQFLRCLSHHDDRFTMRPNLTVRPCPSCPHDNGGGEYGADARLRVDAEDGGSIRDRPRRDRDHFFCKYKTILFYLFYLFYVFVFVHLFASITTF